MSDKHELKTEVKAATYSGLKVWEEADKIFVQIIVDV
jgi:SHS2 domain-containing protein